MNYLDYVCKRFKNCSFENYNVTAENKDAFNSCKEYCKNFEQNSIEGNNLIICGNVGVGKTHLAYAIKRELFFNKNITDIIITDMMKLICEVKQSFNNGGKFESYSSYQSSFKCDLVIIDEVGVQYGTEAERIMMYELFNRRYEDMKPTIVMSNLDKGGLEKVLGQRITDRLCGEKNKYIFIKDKSKR